MSQSVIPTYAKSPQPIPLHPHNHTFRSHVWRPIRDAFPRSFPAVRCLSSDRSGARSILTRWIMIESGRLRDQMGQRLGRGEVGLISAIMRLARQGRAKAGTQRFTGTGGAWSWLVWVEGCSRGKGVPYISIRYPPDLKRFALMHNHFGLAYRFVEGD